MRYNSLEIRHFNYSQIHQAKTYHALDGDTSDNVLELMIAVRSPCHHRILHDSTCEGVDLR